MGKKKVLFVGSFLSKSKTGGVGGQMYACNSLINSSLKEEFEWLLIDTTAESNLKVSIWKKLPKVVERFLKLFYYITFFKLDYFLVFTSNGLSFLEKGIMVILVKKLSKAKVILSPRSGRLMGELKTKKLVFGRQVFANTDRIICQGESWRNFFLEYVNDDEKKYVVQMNWIDTKPYTYEKKEGLSLNILFLGWLEKDKGIFDLIDAVGNIVSNKHPSFKVIIAGRGKDEEDAKDYVTKLGLENYFDFRGWILGKDKMKVLQTSDVFVLPSYFEGLPNALLESMASGLACIATKVGAIPDVIDSGKNGVLIDCGDVQTLARELKIMISDSDFRKKIQRNAALYVRKEHELVGVVDNFRNNILV